MMGRPAPWADDIRVKCSQRCCCADARSSAGDLRSIGTVMLRKRNQTPPESATVRKSNLRATGFDIRAKGVYGCARADPVVGGGPGAVARPGAPRGRALDAPGRRAAPASVRPLHARG